MNIIKQKLSFWIKVLDLKMNTWSLEKLKMKLAIEEQTY